MDQLVSGKLATLTARLANLKEDWPDALRMVLSTALAAVVSMALHLPETYWAVLSAVIVGKPNSGGSARAGSTRLIGTVLGCSVALCVIVGRTWHVPELVLLVAAMIPLSLLVTAFDEFRTAPVAAIILLSSGSALLSPLHLAMLRIAEITIGSLSSVLIGLLVLPDSGHGRVFRLGGSLVSRIGGVLVTAFDDKRDDGRLDAAHDEIRRDLRDLGALVRVKVRRGAPRVQAHMVRLISRLQADAQFVGRVVGSGIRRENAVEYAQAVRHVFTAVGDCMKDTGSTNTGLKQCAEDLRAATGRLGASSPADALDFLLRTLSKDLHDLIRVLQATRPE